MYTETNFRTKKIFKEALTNGCRIKIYQPGGMFNPPEGKSDYTGKATIEGPHYPAPHTWYASVELVNGFVTKIK